MPLTIADRERIASHIAHGWKLPDSLVLLLWDECQRLQEQQAELRRLRDLVEWERSLALLYQTQRDLAELALEDRDHSRVTPALLDAAASSRRYLNAEIEADILRDALNTPEATVAEGRAEAVVREHIQARQSLVGALAALDALVTPMERTV